MCVCRSDEQKAAAHVLTPEEREDGEVHLAEPEARSQAGESAMTPPL